MGICINYTCNKNKESKDVNVSDDEINKEVKKELKVKLKKKKQLKKEKKVKKVKKKKKKLLMMNQMI